MGTPLPRRTSVCLRATAQLKARCWARRRITPSPAAPATQKTVCATPARKTRRTACAPLPATGAFSWNFGPCPRRARRKYGVPDAAARHAGALRAVRGAPAERTLPRVAVLRPLRDGLCRAARPAKRGRQALYAAPARAPQKAFLARRVSPDVSAATPDPALFGYAPLRRSPFFICSNLHQTALPRRAFPCAAALFLPGKGECASRRVQESGRPYCSAHHAAMAACAFFTSRPKIARLFSIFAPGQSF